MKYSFLLVCFLIIGVSVPSRAQNRQQVEFIRDYFKNKEPVLYTDKIDVPEYVLTMYREAFNRDTLKTSRLQAMLVLTKNEKDYILAKARKMQEESVDRNVLKKSVLIPRSELNEIFKDRIYGWQQFTKKYGAGFYSFSKPIFIRNGSVCFFYADYACGKLCGNGELAAYKKVAGKWTKWFVLQQYVS